MLAPSSAITGSPFVLDSSAILKLISSVSSFFFLFEFGWNWWNPTVFEFVFEFGWNCWFAAISNVFEFGWNPTVFVGRKLTPQFHDWGVYQTFMFLGYSWTQGTGKIIEQLQIFREDHIDSGMSHKNHTSWRHWTDGSYGESSPFMAKNLDYFRVSDALL